MDWQPTKRYITPLHQMQIKNGRPSKRKPKVVTAEKLQYYKECAVKTFVDKSRTVTIGDLSFRYNLCKSQATELFNFIVEARQKRVRWTDECLKTESFYLNSQWVDITEIEQHLARIRLRLERENVKSGEQTSIEEGFIYIVTNSAWSNWVKGGMTLDYQERLAAYNVYDPISDYKMFGVKYTSDRRNSEKELLELLEKHSSSRKGEWFEIDKDLAKELLETL